MMDHTPETKIAILEAKVDHMISHVNELTKRVRANEKVVAIVSAIGIGAGGIVGTSVFSPKAGAEVLSDTFQKNAFNANTMIERIREWDAEKTRTNPESVLNNALADLDWYDGSIATTEPEVMLQLPSDEYRQSVGRRHDRCNNRSWFRIIQKRTSEDSGC